MMRGAFSDPVKVLSFKFAGKEKGIAEHPREGDGLGWGEGPGGTSRILANSGNRDRWSPRTLIPNYVIATTK